MAGRCSSTTQEKHQGGQLNHYHAGLGRFARLLENIIRSHHNLAFNWPRETNMTPSESLSEAKSSICKTHFPITLLVWLCDFP